MEDIKVGEYVRLENGIIGKVIGIFDGHCRAKYHIEFQGDVKVKRQYLSTKTIKKHSKNIIKLIELEDVIEIYLPVRKFTIKIYVDKYFEDSMILNGLINGNIILKTILTHEQYNRNCYKVEGE